MKKEGFDKKGYCYKLLIVNTENFPVGYFLLIENKESEKVNYVVETSGNLGLEICGLFEIDAYESDLLQVKYNNESVWMTNTRIYNALNKAKIGIPFPQMDVHLKR